MADSTPVEEVGRILAVPKGGVEKAGRDLYREGWVEEQGIKMSWVDLEEELVHMAGAWEEGEEVGTLEEAVEIICGILVEVEEDRLMLENNRKTNVVTRHLAMVKWTLHYYRRKQLLLRHRTVFKR